MGYYQVLISFYNVCKEIPIFWQELVKDGQEKIRICSEKTLSENIQGFER